MNVIIIAYRPGSASRWSTSTTANDAGCTVRRCRLVGKDQIAARALLHMDLIPSEAIQSSQQLHTVAFETANLARYISKAAVPIYHFSHTLLYRVLFDSPARSVLPYSVPSPTQRDTRPVPGRRPTSTSCLHDQPLHSSIQTYPTPPTSPTRTPNVTMSQIHAMSDDQVANELRKMTAFIRQEALEKAREIHLKADEEFSIEKSKLVREEKSRIDDEYAKKFTQASMSQQITKSTLANKTRLRVLSARQELLDGLFEKANGKIAKEGTSDKGKYEKVLSGLILEGLYALDEEKVTVRCRKKDEEAVKKAAESAKKEYKEKMKGKTVEVQVDQKERLPEGW